MTEPLTDQQITAIRAELGPGDWPGEILRLRALVAEMTRCRDNALAALYRDDVETDPHLPDLFADGLHGLYEWEDQPEPDQAPPELVDRCVRIVQPAFGKLTQERDSLRTELEQARTAISVDDLAQLIHAADVHVNDGHYPSWADLSDTPSLGKDDVRKAARWLLERLNITPRTTADGEPR